MKKDEVKRLGVVNALIIFLQVVIFISCSTDQSQIKEGTKSDTMEILTDSIMQINTAKPIVDSNRMIDKTTKIERTPLFEPSACLTDSLPFGCTIVRDHKFPKVFDSHSYSHFSEKHEPHVKEEYALGDCYQFINEKKPIPYPFADQKNERMEFKDLPYLAADTIPFKIDFYNYQLPDFGLYKCYYSYQAYNRVGKGQGYLFFYNKKIQTTKVVKIYERDYGDYWASTLCYFIDKNKTIYLYSFHHGEQEVEFSKLGTIKILADGNFETKK